MAPILPTQFLLIGPSVKEMNFKIDFQDGDQVGRLGYPIYFISAIFYLQVPSILPMKFRVILACQLRKGSSKDIFKDGGHDSHLGVPMVTILANFDPQVNSILHIKIKVSWPFGSR